MIGIVGPRGVGKTTMLLQYIKQHHTGKKSLYVSADNTYFTTHTLIELVDEWANGGSVRVVFATTSLHCPVAAISKSGCYKVNYKS